MNRTEERKRATELKTPDVRQVINASLPAVLPQITPPQLDQLQRVLDAAVINEDLQQKYEQLDHQTILGRLNSNQYLRDPVAVARLRPDKVLAQKIVIKPGDNLIPIDYRKLLTPEAFKPTSDNPDEAAYLMVVAEIYQHRGVSLLLDSSMGAMTQRLHPSDPKKWRARLLLGNRPGGLEEIKTAKGGLDRDAVLSVSRLGAGYYEWVHQGPTLRSLERALDQVSAQLNLGRNEHVWWSAHREEFRIVSRISDKLGGADWPSESIWDQPHQIYRQALHLRAAGKVMDAMKFALLASYQAQWCARAVHEYIDATTSGAGRAVKILEVAVVMGKVADAILMLIGVGYGLIRILGRKGGTLAIEGTAQRQLTGGGQRQLPAAGQTTPTPVAGNPTGGAPVPGPRAVTVPIETAPPAPGVLRGGVVKDRGDIGQAVDALRKQAGLPPRQGKTWYDKLGANESIQRNKAHQEYMEWLVKNPNASLEEKIAKHDRDIIARFGPLD